MLKLAPVVSTTGMGTLPVQITFAKKEKTPAPTKRLMSFFTKLPKLVLRDSPEAGPSSATVEPACLSSVLDPLLVSITRSNTSTLDLFPDAGQYDKDLQSAQLSPAVGEISPLDFNINVHQDSDKPVFTARGTMAKGS